MPVNSVSAISTINLRMMFSEGIKTDDAVISLAFWDLLKEVIFFNSCIYTEDELYIRVDELHAFFIRNISDVSRAPCFLRF